MFPNGRLTKFPEEITNTAQLEAAIQRGAHCLSVKAGNYSLTKDLNLSSIDIKGCGVVNIETNGNTWSLTGNVILDNLRLTDTGAGDILSIDGTNKINNCILTQTDSSTYCIDLNNGSDVLTMENCVLDGDGTGRLMTDKQDTSNNSGALNLVNCQFINGVNAGIQTIGTQLAKINNCLFDNNDEGIKFLTPNGTDGTASWLISNSTFSNNTYGIEFTTVSRVYTNKIFTSCSFDTNVSHILTDSTEVQCQVSSCNILNQGTTSDVADAVGAELLDIKNNYYLRTTTSNSNGQYESRINCDTTSNNITITLVALPKESKGAVMTIQKTSSLNALFIAGTVLDFPVNTTWTTVNQSHTFEWSGTLWKRQDVGYSEEYAIYDLTSDLTIADGGSAKLVSNWDRQEGNAIWTMSGGVLTVKAKGIYYANACISWASNGSGTRRVYIRKNNSTTLQTIQKQFGLETGVFSHAVSAMFQLDSDDTLRVMAYQNSSGNLDLLSADGDGQVSQFGVSRIS